MRVAFSMLLATALAGCAGGFSPFKTDQQFQTYIDSLHLSSLSVPEASSTLAASGFSCQPSPQKVGHTLCIRSAGRSQSQVVDLAPVPDAPSACIVVAFLAWVYAKA